MLLGVVTSGPDWIEYCDDASGIYHAAYFENGRLQACLYIAPPTMLPARGWLSELFMRARLTTRDRLALLAGASLGASEDGGPLVCSRSEEHTSELQSLMRSAYAVFCLKK